MSDTKLNTQDMLAKNLSKANTRLATSLFLVLYLTLIIVVFVLLKHIAALQLISLLKSQNFSASIQDWRQVLNGIKSGWSFYPKLTNICLYRNDVLVANDFACPNNDIALQFFTGTYGYAKNAEYLIVTEFKVNIWPASLLIPLAVLLPSLVFSSLFRKPLLKRAYLDIAQKIQNLNLNTNDKYEQIIHNQMSQLIKMNEQKTFFDVARQVAHDIRSPLSALQILSASGIDTNEKKALLQEIIQRIRKVADDLLKNEPTATLRHIDPVSFMKKFMQIKRLELDKHVELLSDFSSAPPSILANENSLMRILSNLVNNSVEAGSNKINFVISASKAECLLQVLDNGRGIPAEAITKLGREQISCGKTDGHGIALLSAKEQLAKCSARIRFSNTALGAAVEIAFPLAH